LKSSREKKLAVNAAAALLQMVINYGISFLFTPYLVAVSGSEAYGFVTMANHMVDYATIITVALNSVAGRFITIKVHQGNGKEANEYFNSVLWADCILTFGIGVVFACFIANMSLIFDIPVALVQDVKLLFVFVVVNFMITIASNVFTVATFITNQLFLSNIGNCVSSLLRVLLLALLFGIFPANIAYVGAVSCICSISLAVYNIILTTHLDTSLKINVKQICYGKIKEMFVSGIWSSVTKLSQVLTTGLDIIIANIWIDSYAMGQLSIAYNIPTLLSSFISQISSLFNPQQTYYYAKGEIRLVIKELRANMMLTGYFVSIAFAGVIVFGYHFFELWTPAEDIPMLYRLSILSIISILVSGIASALNSVYLLTDHLKTNSLVWLAVSAVDLILVLILVSTTKLGVYAVAGTSRIVGLVVNLIYTPLYSCHCLKISKITFYPMIIRYICCSLMLIVIMAIFRIFLPAPDSWGLLILDCGVAGTAGLAFNYIFLLNREERKILSNITRKIKKKILK